MTARPGDPAHFGQKPPRDDYLDRLRELGALDNVDAIDSWEDAMRLYFDDSGTFSERRHRNLLLQVLATDPEEVTPELLHEFAFRIVDGGAEAMYRHMDAVFEHSRASGNARLVLLAIAKSANQAAEAWRGAASLAAMCGISVRTVERALAELRELGEIERIGPAMEVARADRRPIKYRLKLPTDDPSGCRPAGSDGPTDCPSRPDNLSPTVRQIGGGRDKRKRSEEALASAKPNATRDPLFDALTAAVGIDVAALTRSARGAVNRALAELRAVGATPEEIRARAKRYRQKWPRVSLTASALAKHWHELPPPVRAGQFDEGITYH